MRSFWVLLLCWCASCGCEPALRVVAPDSALLRYAGRVDRESVREPRLSWAATEIHLRFQAPAVSLIATDTPFEDTVRETDWLNVELDGKVLPPLALREGKQRYLLVHGLTDGPHTLVLRKRTEPEVGTIRFHGFELPAGAKVLAAARAPKRRIEVVGDSISAGYGNEGKSADCHWSAPTEDASRSYAAIAARELDAELGMAAWSGKGVTRNYDARDTVSLIDVFDRGVPTDPSSRPVPPLPAPDVLVLNMGTNDFLAGNPEERDFMPALRHWVERMKLRAPKARLFLILSPMLADDYPHPGSRGRLKHFLKLLIAQYAEQGEKVGFLEQFIDPAEGLGCDFHPNLRTHARLGHELAEHIRSELGW